MEDLPWLDLRDRDASQRTTAGVRKGHNGYAENSAPGGRKPKSAAGRRDGNGGGLAADVGVRVSAGCLTTPVPQYDQRMTSATRMLVTLTIIVADDSVFLRPHSQRRPWRHLDIREAGRKPSRPVGKLASPSRRLNGVRREVAELDGMEQVWNVRTGTEIGAWIAESCARTRMLDNSPQVFQMPFRLEESCRQLPCQKKI